MAPNGEWQVVRRRRRFPDNWRTPSDVDLDKVSPYIPYSSKPTFAQVVARTTPQTGNTTGSGSSGGSARPSSNGSQSASPQTPPGTHYFHSPHSPTQLRFPPQATFPEWHGRFFRCCRMGHTQARCRNPRKCGKCWNNGHIASQCKTHMLNPAARPCQPKAHVYKLVRAEPMFDELLRGDSHSPKPTLPEGRPDKITVFIKRDETFFQEVESLGRAVVMYCSNQPHGIETHQVLKIAVDTKLVNENEVKVSKLANEKFLIHLPVGLAVKTFVSALSGYLWDQGFSFQQWSLLDDATVTMPRFKVLIDLVGLPPHQWKESSVINATSKMGLFLGTVANEHASDLSARRVAIATNNLSNIPNNLALVIGGLEYPVQVKPVAWESGPIYSTADFPILSRRFSRPPPQPPSRPEAVSSEEGSDSDGQGCLNDDELIPCSRRVLMEICQGRRLSNIPPEILAFIKGRRGPAEISIGALEQLVFDTEDHAEYYNHAGQIVTADGELVSTITTPEAAASVQGQSVQQGLTTFSNLEDAHGEPKSCTPNGTRTLSILETGVGSVQGTDADRVRKGKQSVETQITCVPKTKKKDTLGLQKVDNQLTGPSLTRLIPQQTEGKQVKDHESYENPFRQMQPFSFPTSRHNRFKEVLGRGRGCARLGRDSRHVVSQDLSIGRSNSFKTIKRGSQLIGTSGNSLREVKKKGSEAWLMTQARGKYKWTRGAQSIPVEVINEAVGNPTMGQNTQAQKHRTILKRKPTSLTLEQNFQARETSKRPAQEVKGGLHTDQQAQINLNPEAFFRVSVQKKLCLDIAKGCGLNPEVVTQTLQRDNDERRVELQQQGESNQEDEQGPQVNLDPDSEDELSATEEY